MKNEIQPATGLGKDTGQIRQYITRVQEAEIVDMFMHPANKSARGQKSYIAVSIAGDKLESGTVNQDHGDFKRGDKVKYITLEQISGKRTTLHYFIRPFDYPLELR
ncbi:MAG TPA: hypothetical protein VG965_04445 [Patescibacteria group bacterium]|nr:hypothetical protein [Patescibacteria group bacterium]